MKPNGFALLSSAFCAISLLAACGGGGGGGAAAPAVPLATASPCPPGYSGTPPACTPAESTTAKGRLVDHDTGLPLAGVAVGLAPWIAGATPVPQPTTDANGTFTVAANSGGKYLLVIGSDSPDDANNRATIHDAIVLSASGSPQQLVAPTMPPIPSTTPNPIETSGNFRLVTLDANELACLTYENSKRASLGYSPVVEDEWLAENQRMAVEQELNGGGVGGGGFLSNYNRFDGSGCQHMIDGDYSVAVNMGNAHLIWYGADEISPLDSAVDEGMLDPRGPLPLPTPPNAWP